MNDSKKVAKHPIQPLVLDRGVVRFKENAIVSYLIDLADKNSICDMNAIALLHFSDEDRAQFAQLIGYSLSGFGYLPYVSDKIYNAATAQPVMRKSNPSRKREGRAA
jgi:hypothetical protein